MSTRWDRLGLSTLSIADARANFSKIVGAAETTHERFEVTRDGGPIAVLLGVDDYDALVETVAVLGDNELLAAIREGLADIEDGRTSSIDEVRAEMAERGRLRG